MNEPKYKVGQPVKVTLSWAKNIPAKLIEDIVWDESWNCYTYGFAGSLFRIEEHDLIPIEEYKQEAL